MALKIRLEAHILVLSVAAVAAEVAASETATAAALPASNIYMVDSHGFCPGTVTHEIIIMSEAPVFEIKFLLSYKFMVIFISH